MHAPLISPTDFHGSLPTSECLHLLMSHVVGVVADVCAAFSIFARHSAALQAFPHAVRDQFPDWVSSGRASALVQTQRR
jgi:hypothetical protein